MATRYLEAEAALVRAENLALAAGDWDTLARLYMPLQESRRQRRQVCGEGGIKLDLLAAGPDDRLDAEHVLTHVAHGQLLVAGWATLEPAVEVRRIAAERGLYVETFLAAVYPVAGGGRAVAVVPLAAELPPPAEGESPDDLARRLPEHSVVLDADDLPRGHLPGTDETFARTMALWERLHAPFLAAAAEVADPRVRIDAYRRTIAVDYACEKAHQWLSGTAGEMGRK